MSGGRKFRPKKMSVCSSVFVKQRERRGEVNECPVRKGRAIASPVVRAVRHLGTFTRQPITLSMLGIGKIEVNESRPSGARRHLHNTKA